VRAAPSSFSISDAAVRSAWIFALMSPIA
jgi:hypothetical protein